VEREVQRIVGNKSLPVALPMQADPAPPTAKPKQGAPTQRPEAGPVVPLTITRDAPEELLGGGRAASAATDTTVSRTLTTGEPVAAPSGRADDFGWPRGAVNVEPAAATVLDTATPRPSVMDAYAAQTTGQEQKRAQSRPRPRPKPRALAQPRQSFPFFGFVR
jgi:uncharacterized protein